MLLDRVLRAECVEGQVFEPNAAPSISVNPDERTWTAV